MPSAPPAPGRNLAPSRPPPRAAGDKSAWTVRVKPGFYVLERSLVFTPADSGEPAAPVCWVGEEGKSIISGGARIANWKDEGNGVWSAPLPRDAKGKPAFFEQLWVNGRRAERAEVQHIPCTFHFHNNIVLVREGPLASWDILNVGGVWANNVWYDVSGKPKFAHNLDWAKWCATGHEVNGVYADPLFVDATKCDFRLKPESPAFKVGFKAWDYGAAGARLKLK